MLMALLLPDPVEPHCPVAFKHEARQALTNLAAAPARWAQKVRTDVGLRSVLLEFIGDLANWDVAEDDSYLQTARTLIGAAHGDELPLVVDPFAGGGSIPLEALRIGCDAFASDLNPVACLVLRTMLEDIPRSDPGIEAEVRQSGEEIQLAVEESLRDVYPQDPDGGKPIAYLWARTVRCESVGCGAEIPLVRSFWLSKKSHRKRALRYEIVRKRREVPILQFAVFSPRSDVAVPGSTVTRAKATCPACGNVMPPNRVREQVAKQHGGADVRFDARGQRIGGALLLAVVTLNPKQGGRHYRVATDSDYAGVLKAQRQLQKLLSQRLPNGLSAVPDEPTPAGGGAGAGRAFSVQKYGMVKFADLFTARQLLLLATIARKMSGQPDNSPHRRLVAFVVSRLADRSASLVSWDAGGEKLGHVFNRQALPIVWDFAEGAALADATGSFQNILRQIEQATGAVRRAVRAPAQVQLADACDSPLPDGSASVWFTDPPYYDAVPYADLSDFFLVWLRRALPPGSDLRDPFDPHNPLSPKEREIVQDETKSVNGHPKDREFFEGAMARAFAEGRRVLSDDGIGSVVFAHKTTEGWESLLSGLVKGGWSITASWPIATERQNRLRSRESAALATSVHLVCRPRPPRASVGDWSDVARELPGRIGDWMERLSAEGVRGADLVFACIGPAMEVYSRYSRVEDAEGREIPLGGNPEATKPHQRGFLAYVWELVGRAALNQVLGTGRARPADGVASTLEEDARLTALFLWTLQSTEADEDEQRELHREDETDEDEGESGGRGGKKKGLTLIFDVVRRFAQPMGIHLPEWEGRIIEVEKGVVRLLPVQERAEQLFGEEGAAVVAGRIESGARRDPQIAFDFVFDAGEQAPRVRSRGERGRAKAASVRDEDLTARRSATTLDRVHAAMLLQAAGRASALRTFVHSEMDRGPEFRRLANALSALYPKDSEEKRLLDAMLLAVPR